MKALYLCCRYYPLTIWILITWAYIGDHDADTCSHFTRLVHALIAPCVRTLNSFSSAALNRTLTRFAAILRARYAHLQSFLAFMQGLTSRQTAVMLIRAVAFSGQDVRVLALLGSCYLCLVGVDVWVFCVEVDVPPTILFTVLGGTGCFPNYGNEGMGRRIGVSLIDLSVVLLLY